MKKQTTTRALINILLDGGKLSADSGTYYVVTRAGTRHKISGSTYDSLLNIKPETRSNPARRGPTKPKAGVQSRGSQGMRAGQEMAGRRRAIRRQLGRKDVRMDHILGSDDKALRELRRLRKANGLLGDIARGLGRAAKKTGKAYAKMVKATHRPKFAAAERARSARGRRATDKTRSAGAVPDTRLEFTDAEIRQMIKDRDPRISARPHRSNPSKGVLLTRGGMWIADAQRERKANSGIGRQFTFHGAYDKKSDAVKKEASTPGAFVKFVLTRHGGRFLVMKPNNETQENPRTRKKNVEFGEYEKGIFHPWTRRSVTQLRVAKRGTRRTPRPYSSKGLNVRTNPKGKQRFVCPHCGKRFGLFEAYNEHMKYGQHKLKDKIISGIKHELGIKRKNPRARKANGPVSDAAQLYRDFHGRDATKLTDVLQRIISRDAYAGLGTLCRLVLEKKTELNFPETERENVMLASDTRGRQLFLIGGDQDVSPLLDGRKDLDRTKDLIDLGELTDIEYFTRKKFDNFKPITYVHEFGEVSGVKPRLMYDRLNKQLHIAGGKYQVEPEGIVD